MAGAYHIPTMGLDKLARITEELLPDAHKNAFVAVQRLDFQSRINKAHAIVVSAACTGILAANLWKMIPGVGSIAGGIISAGVAGTIITTFGEAYIGMLVALFKENGNKQPTAEQLLAKKDCLGMISNNSIDIAGLICYPTNVITNQSLMEDGERQELLQDLFHRCTTTNIEQTCSHSSLFHCSRSLKCISKYRLIDGISDCYYNEDEMNEIQRNILQGYVSIGLLCGKKKEKLLEKANETDETNCEYWPRNNPCIRCDGISNCPNQTDELNCPWLEYTVKENDCSKTIATDRFCYRTMLLLETKFDIRIIRNNQSKFGTKCYLSHSICEQLINTCQNNGLCIPDDDRIGLKISMGKRFINNTLEKKTGLDLNHDGFVGSEKNAEKQYGVDFNGDGYIGGEGIQSKVERTTHVDLNNDGIIGRPLDTYPGGYGGPR
ncbi:hypothetical protein I4U23_016537 [Adineta vaga]|nr:hypothetical protein I4U23_016537 [Adineta vaga]